MILAAYARYSSDAQRCESVDEQFREIKEYTYKHGHEIAAYFSDPALSGKYDIRPEFERMLSIAKSPDCPWQGVNVFDLSRFSRGGEYGILDELRLKENGKVLISVTETFTEDLGGKLYKHIKYLMNEEFIESLRKNTARGLKENALVCKHNGGTPPLGYDVGADGKLVINEHEAEAVRLIFTMFAQRHPYIDIIKTLNQRGYKTKRNNAAFGKNSLHAILINKKYVGIFEYGKVKRKKVKSSEKKSTVTPGENVIVHPDGCPKIISQELWNEVQKMKKTRTQFNSRAKVDYILSGKIICGKCNAKYNGTTKGKDKKPYYECHNRKSEHPCKNRSIAKLNIEKEIIKQIHNVLNSEDGKKTLKKLIIQYNDCVNTPEALAQQKENLQKIKKLETRLARAQEAYLNGDIELVDFRKIKNEIQINIDILTSSLTIKSSVISESRIIKLIDTLQETLCSDIEIINTLVEKVIVYPEKIQVILNTSFFTDPPDSPPPKDLKNRCNSADDSPPPHVGAKSALNPTISNDIEGCPLRFFMQKTPSATLLLLFAKKFAPFVCSVASRPPFASLSLPTFCRNIFLPSTQLL